MPGTVRLRRRHRWASLTRLYAPLAVAVWPRESPSPRALVALVGLAVVCTALGLVLLFELVAEVGAARAVVFTYVNPAVAVLAGVVVLGEPATPVLPTAFALILAGSVLATRPSAGARRERARPDPPVRRDQSSSV